jgi:hypothetical protein
MDYRGLLKNPYYSSRERDSYPTLKDLPRYNSLIKGYKNKGTPN